MASGKRQTTPRLSRVEERLLIEGAQHDRARFADLYDEYFEITYAYIARRVQRRSEAEDVTAEVFRKALENLPRFKWTGAPFASWLMRIAGNTIVDRGKRASRETNVDSDESNAPVKSSPSGSTPMAVNGGVASISSRLASVMRPKRRGSLNTMRTPEDM